MAKLNTDTRSVKLKRVTFSANAKSKSVPLRNGSSDANPAESERNVITGNGDGDPRPTDSEQTVALANGRRDSSTSASEFVDPPPTSPEAEDIYAVNPNPDFVANEELVVVKHGRDAANFQLAVYIAMAHAGLMVAIAICYGFGLLLKDYWMPIQWALLVSMPLQRVQEAVVKFWMRHLQAGLVEAFFAVPAAMVQALLQTARDVLSLSLAGHDGLEDEVTFGKLFDWLFSLATCTLLFENLGPVYSMAVACVGCAIYWALTHMHSVVSAGLPGWLHHAQERRGTGAVVLDFTVRATRWSNRGVAGTLIRNVQFLVAIQLVVLMMVGFIGGTILFSYKVGVETKDAIIALKLHMDSSRSEPGKGISNWLVTNSTSHYIDSHMIIAYDTVVQKVDKYAEKNNLTAIANTAKEVLSTIAYDEKISSNGKSSPTTEETSFWDKFMAICQILQEKFEKRELKQVMTNMTGGFPILVVLGSNVASFIKQVVMFAVVLFFFITSETGGVMEQALEMVPLSEVTRQKCAFVLDRTISTVFLTTGKSMLFQALFTYLFFRFLKIHFLYMSTSIAMVQGLMPIFPNWVASLPALLQLLAERRFVSGLLTTLIYKFGMDYGICKIQGDVSNSNRYLTGLSIAGGMALFQPAICGVIMGPLILTCIIAIRDLYSEFVLKIVNDYQRI
ncbi:hypothetical protein M758_6G009500 [Ceratodon purpureus]|nr:hypothetical protein M758_6G009500 [Ceratodon purpureus]